VGRAFGFERAVLEPLWSDGLVNASADESGLAYAVGVGIRSAGVTGALCAACPDPSLGDHATLLQAVESHGRLASLCLDEPGLLEGLLASALGTAKARGGAAVVSAGRIRAFAAETR
jgi:hypothetical protein